MDYQNAVSKDSLHDVLDSLAPGSQAYAMLARLLTQKNFDPEPFTYSAVYSVAAASATNSLASGALNVPANVNIQADADFLILNSTYFADTAQAAETAAGLVVPLVSILINDTGSGKYLQDQAVPVPAIFGTGQFPYIWPQPYLAKAKTTLQVLATNYDASAGYNLRLCFNGVKLRTYG